MAGDKTNTSAGAVAGRPARRRARFGVFEADFASGELRKSGTRLRLQGQPFQVLEVLLDRAGGVVTREELRQRLWPADTFVDFDHSLNTAINKVREALGDSASTPRFLETLPKRGYRFVAPVEWVNTAATVGEAQPATPAAITQEAPRPRGEHELPRANRTLVRFLLALIQVMYLSFYVVSLARIHRVGDIAEGALPGMGWPLLVLLIASAALGIPVRLYLFTAAAFDYAGLGQNLRRLFPLLLPLDELWALAPFLLVEQIGFGLAFAATAALLYVPFSQRTLVRMAYP